ncbi:methylmalonyl-CoA epimerase [Evansella sp. AB-P1]|uniref:methylmalonyl-CoA epimerase n=1 Tax=Evansella sp. AB-P1 TaxID=3037653 RepID=UPI00241DB91B|nr:methylmalonyl-CoA epimerase [Evansella sp. AB-P1]MDG5788657.1 methylmalonyl-CoA epimerase [Evansella sp. AB-P1]
MRKIRVLVAKPGLDGHDRGALIISQALRDAGMEVIYTGLRQTPKKIVKAAIQEDVDAIGLSSLSGAHNVLFPEVVKLLKTENAEDILVFGGGVIPYEDIKNLEQNGIKKIFTPGTSTKTIAAFIEKAVMEKRNGQLGILDPPNGIDHIGIAVRSIDDALLFYRNHFSIEVEKVVEVESQQVKVAFLPLTNCKLELLEPLSDDGAIAKFINKKGEGIHHIAFSVNSLQDRLDQLKKEGVKLINETPKNGAGGYPIAFLHPKNANGVLVELCETHNNEGDE